MDANEEIVVAVMTRISWLPSKPDPAPKCMGFVCLTIPLEDFSCNWHAISRRKKFGVVVR